MDDIRIYVSASTGELGAERAMLAEVVLPRLRELAAAAGKAVSFALADPEARSASWSLKDRLRAIDACPLFVAFLGERLGAPLPPPQVELVRQYPWLADLAGASLGEAELVYGALLGRETPGFLYLRTPGFPVPPRERLRFAAATREEADRLEQLKASLRASGQPLVDGYACRWDPAARRLAGLEALGERLVDDLWTAVSAGPSAARPRPSPPAPRPAPPPLVEREVERRVEMPIERPGSPAASETAARPRANGAETAEAIEAETPGPAAQPGAAGAADPASPSATPAEPAAAELLDDTWDDPWKQPEEKDLPPIAVRPNRRTSPGLWAAGILLLLVLVVLVVWFLSQQP